MTETQLKTANDLHKDRKTVYDQMFSMKQKIEECSRKVYETEDAKEDFDDFKIDLLNQCDKWVEDQRKKIDTKFSKL